MDDRRKARIAVGRDLLEPARLLGVRVAVGVGAADEPNTEGACCSAPNDPKSSLAGVVPVSRWCIRSRVETTGGVFQVQEDEPSPRVRGRASPAKARGP
jgi:hypothetical protein